MWRPEGFYENIANMPVVDRENLVEFIADAMLEALRYDGVKSSEIGNTITGNRLSVWVDKHQSGTWVFIPDEVKE